MSKVLVFGAFDGLHPGHGHFLAEAKALADELIVCLATDTTIARLKGHQPKFSFTERQAALELLPSVDRVVAGDEREGDYSAIVNEQPAIIAFGYDQQALHDDCVGWLNRHGVAAHTVFLEPFAPDKYKSSLLNT